METTVKGEPLELRASWSARDFAIYIIDEVFPDIYQLLTGKAPESKSLASTSIGTASHPWIQRDEYIPALYRYSKATLFQLPRPFDGKQIFTKLLVQTSRQTSRLAFSMSFVIAMTLSLMLIVYILVTARPVNAEAMEILKAKAAIRKQAIETRQLEVAKALAAAQSMPFSRLRCFMPDDYDIKDPIFLPGSSKMGAPSEANAKVPANTQDLNSESSDGFEMLDLVTTADEAPHQTTGRDLSPLSDIQDSVSEYMDDDLTLKLSPERRSPLPRRNCVQPTPLPAPWVPDLGSEGDAPNPFGAA